MKATETGGDVVGEDVITMTEIEAFEDTGMLFGIAAGHVVFNESVLETIKNQDQLVKSVGVFGSQKVGKSTLLKALFGVDAKAGDSLNVHTTNGIELFVKDDLAIFDSEGAESADKFKALGKAKNQKTQELARAYRGNLEASLMVIAVAMCNPIIYVFEKPNGSDRLLSVIEMAIKKLKIDDHGDRQLIVVYNKFEDPTTDSATDLKSLPCFENIAEDFSIKGFFSGGTEFSTVRSFANSDRKAFDTDVGKLRETINKMATNSRQLGSVLKTMQKVTESINTKTGIMYLNGMMAEIDKEICDNAVAAQQAEFSKRCSSKADITPEQMEAICEDVLLSLKVDGVPEAMAMDAKNQLSTWLAEQAINMKAYWKAIDEQKVRFEKDCFPRAVCTDDKIAVFRESVLGALKTIGISDNMIADAANQLSTWLDEQTIDMNAYWKAIEELKTEWKTSHCAGTDVLTEQKFLVLKEGVLKNLEARGMSASLLEDTKSDILTFVNTEFNKKFKRCTVKCSCPKQAECTLGNVAHEGAIDEKHQCGETLQCNQGCTKGTPLRCEEVPTCNHCQEECPDHQGTCTLSRWHVGVCKFTCRAELSCVVCGAGVNTNCSKRFTCKCCADNGHHWTKHQHQKINVPVSPPSGFFAPFTAVSNAIVNAHWQCAAPGCHFSNGMFRWDTLVGSEHNGGSCTSACSNCDLYRVRDRVVTQDKITVMHG